MAEHGIIMSAPMVRALLAGTKTQTRRVVKSQPDAAHDGEPYWFVGGYRAWRHRGVTDALRMGGDELRCPYGKAGDRLWVRETWNTSANVRPPIAEPYIYRADLGETGVTKWAARWRPSIHMPRAASRITLEVTGIRMERLQDISEADALAEGFTHLPPPPAPHDWSGPNRFTLQGADLDGCVSWNAPTARALYQRLWGSLHGDDSWGANPWVWVIAFRRVR